MKTQNQTQHRPEWIIRVNGRYFDGFRECREIADAKRYERSVATTINRVIMCGRGQVISAAIAKAKGQI